MPRRRTRRKRGRGGQRTEHDLQYAADLRLDAQERSAQREMKAVLAQRSSAVARRQVFVTNLRFEVRALTVKNGMEQRFGPVTSVFILQQQPQRSSGRAIVEFAEEQMLPIQATTIYSDLGHRGRLNLKPNQATARSHRSAGGSHTVSLIQVDCGSLLLPAAPYDRAQPQPTLVSEWQSSSASNSACFNLQSRCLDLKVMGPQARVYVLQVRFKAIRSMALTEDGDLLLRLRLPPKVLHLAAPCSPDVVQEVQAQPARDPYASSSFQLPHELPSSAQIPEPSPTAAWGMSSLLESLISSLGGQALDASAAGSGFAWPPELDDGFDPNKLSVTTDFTPCGALGRCLAYRLRLSGGIQASRTPDVSALLRILRDFGLLRREVERPPTVLLKTREQVEARAQLLEAETRALPLDLAYLIHCMLSSGLLGIWSDVPALCAAVLSGARRGGDRHAALHAALDSMAQARAPHADPAARLLQLLGSSPAATPPADDGLDVATPGHCMLVPWVLVTPTRVVWMPPRPEMSNRVLRHAAEQRGFSRLDVVRVSFGEEHGGMLYFHDDKAGDVGRRVARAMLGGLHLMGRRMDFLAYSSSQLKERSFWAVHAGHPNSELRPERLRAWMGPFEHIRVPAKYAARMGQCFSTTARADDVPPQQMREIPDVERGGYTFSDGVGQISPDLLLAAVEKLPFAPADPSDVSAIQVRFSGCKGVLASHPPLLGTGCSMCVRPSMTKFRSQHSALEVCAIAGAIPCFLNRHVILLLLHKGVPGAVFLAMQEDMVRQLDRMLVDGAHAARLLPKLGCVSGTCCSMLLGMLRGGVGPEQPLVQACLLAARAHLLAALRKKARVLVEQGVVLMGVMDETATLQPEQLFLQVKDPGTGSWHVHTGRVLVAKHPVMHPGDVRMLLAVDAPALRHMKNVVVFPQLGSRPVPNMLSGSDLDGDQYAVIWDPRLAFPSPNSAPGSYQAAAPTEVPQVQVADLVRHFINHARNDTLGQIANCWLVCAELQGAASPECLLLAAMHSTAVDFPKTGVPSGPIPPAVWKAVEAGYPHWMENKRRGSYRSTGTLGVMYDRLLERAAPTPASPGTQRPGFDVSLVVPGWEAYREEAAEERVWYEGRLVQLMNQHGVECEGEVLTGCVLRYNKLHRRRQADVSEQLKQRVRQLAQEVRDSFLRTLVLELEEGCDEEALQGLEEAELRKLLLENPRGKGEMWKKASAYYHVTYHPQLAASYAIPDCPLHSFCWVAATDVLMDIKAGNT